jgi:hypothetical protein
MYKFNLPLILNFFNSIFPLARIIFITTILTTITLIIRFTVIIAESGFLIFNFLQFLY